MGPYVIFAGKKDMAYPSSVIAIKGNVLQQADLIFKVFRYFDLKSDKAFPLVQEALTYLYQNFNTLIEEEDVVLRGLWADRDFTYFYDPENTDVTDEDALEVLAKKMNTTIYVFLIQETSGAYEFAQYTPKGQMRYFSLSGKDLFSDGDVLPEEEGINLNNATCSGDLLKLAQRLGIDIEFKQTPAPFLVKELGYNEDL